MFLSRYQDRPSTLKADHEIVTNMVIDLEGQKIEQPRKGTVHSLNEFQITVWEDGEVTAQRKYYAKSDPQSTFPNMSVESGSINLPIEDLVAFLLSRITPTELAEGIISDGEARAALLDKLAERYNEPGFTDQDRRAFLTKVQKEVYAVAIGRAIERLNKAEEGHRSRDDYYRWRAIEIGCYKNLHETAVAMIGDDMERLVRFNQCHFTPEKLKAMIGDQRDPVMTENVGPQWHESRDHWRKVLTEYFPEPTIEATPQTEDTL